MKKATEMNAQSESVGEGKNGSAEKKEGSKKA